jgi:hypothetical protein
MRQIKGNCQRQVIVNYEMLSLGGALPLYGAPVCVAMSQGNAEIKLGRGKENRDAHLRVPKGLRIGLAGAVPISSGPTRRPQRKSSTLPASPDAMMFASPGREERLIGRPLLNQFFASFRTIELNNVLQFFGGHAFPNFSNDPVLKFGMLPRKPPPKGSTNFILTRRPSNHPDDTCAAT